MMRERMMSMIASIANRKAAMTHRPIRVGTERLGSTRS
jgi:hypothetical protein